MTDTDTYELADGEAATFEVRVAHDGQPRGTVVTRHVDERTRALIGNGYLVPTWRFGGDVAADITNLGAPRPTAAGRQVTDLGGQPLPEQPEPGPATAAGRATRTGTTAAADTTTTDAGSTAGTGRSGARSRGGTRSSSGRASDGGGTAADAAQG